LDDVQQYQDHGQITNFGMCASRWLICGSCLANCPKCAGTKASFYQVRSEFARRDSGLTSRCKHALLMSQWRTFSLVKPVTTSTQINSIENCETHHAVVAWRCLLSMERWLRSELNWFPMWHQSPDRNSDALFFCILYSSLMSIW
jgi:hypothetical protein